MKDERWPPLVSAVPNKKGCWCICILIAISYLCFFGYRVVKAANEFYFINTGNEIVRIDGIEAKPPAKTATLTFVSDGIEVKKIQGDAVFLYLEDSDGNKYNAGEQVKSGNTYSAVWGQSSVEVPNFYQRGYQFLGWIEAKEASIVYEAREQYVFSTCTTLYALCTGNVYTIRFADSSEVINVEYGKKPQDVNIGLSNKIIFMNGDEIVKVVNGFTGYWYGNRQYYDSGGKALVNWDITEDVILKNGFIEDFDIPVTEKRGYEFIGWSSTGSADDIAAEFYCGIYYAVFKPKTYNVKIAGKTVKVTFGEKLESIDVPSKFGYRFSGYYVKDGEKTVCLFNENGKCMEAWRWDEDKSVFARWSKLQYTDKHTRTLAVGSSITYDLGDKIEEVFPLNEKCSYACEGGSIAFRAKTTGTFKCIVKAGGRNFYFEVIVKKQPKKVSVGFSSKRLKVGQMIQLKPTVGAGYYSSYFYYKSSSPSNVSVNAKGYVEALKKGTAEITVTTSNNKKCRVKVTVRS